MGWGSSEFSDEALADPYFQYDGVVFVASAGDAPGVQYPCTSPHVVCVGGTSTARSIFTGNFLYEVAWMDAAGGFSSYEPRPFYQDRIREDVMESRGVPDVSFDGNPSPGLWILDSNNYEGVRGGGLSSAARAWAHPPWPASSMPRAIFTVRLGRNSKHILPPPPLVGVYGYRKGYCGPYVTFAATMAGISARAWELQLAMTGSEAPPARLPKKQVTTERGAEATGKKSP